MKHFLSIFLFCLSFFTQAQSETSAPKKIGQRIFLPALEIGYMHNNSKILDGGILVNTSIEYRFRNNNDFLLRLNYDTHNAEYKLEQRGFTNVLEGTAFFSDVLLGPGYRFGDNTFRLFVLTQAGVKFYDFPVATVENLNLQIRNSSNTLFTTRIVLGGEYYFDEKSALTISLIQSQVWNKQDFWADKAGAWGISVGFITSLI